MLNKHYLPLLFSSHWVNSQWLLNYLIPCPFKKLTGIDCPGCGFQRSILALLQGHIGQSFQLYPATIPVLLSIVFALVSARNHRIDPKDHIKKSLYIFTALIITGAYLLKMSRYL